MGSNFFFNRRGRSLLSLIGIKDVVVYRSPSNFSYLWSFGSIALYCLVIQIASGIFLAMYYKADVTLAYNSVVYIMNEVELGWFIRYLHMNGASAFFLTVYFHMFRSLLMSSYVNPRIFLWISGVVIFFLMILTAFFGYVLPWGQMSFWAATVITGLITSIPGKGVEIAQWVWGGFAVGDPTLNRFFSLHFFLPFVILGLSIIHMLFLHEYGSTNPIGIWFKVDDVKLYPLYAIKDLIGVLLISIFLAYLIFFNPDYLGHSDNYILANSMVTPKHIVPEWYFLPYYALLRVVTVKIIGVTIMLLSIVGLVFLAWMNYKVRSSMFRPLVKSIILVFSANWILLGIIGGQVPQVPYIVLGVVSVFTYFFLLFCIYIVSQYENHSIYYWYVKNLKW